ncbi:hypothetical protein Tco_0720166, partial [Tanacetum coccineum]
KAHYYSSKSTLNGYLCGDFPKEYYHESLVNDKSTSQLTLYSQVFERVKDALSHEVQGLMKVPTFDDQNKSNENPLDFYLSSVTTLPQDSHELQTCSNTPSVLVNDSHTIQEPVVHNTTFPNETLPNIATDDQCPKVCGHEICNPARKNIHEAKVTKAKDKEKHKNKLHVGFKSDNIRANLVSFLKRKAKCKKNKQTRDAMDKGVIVNNLLNDECSEEEDIDDDYQNVENIGNLKFSSKSRCFDGFTTSRFKAK